MSFKIEMLFVRIVADMKSAQHLNEGRKLVSLTQEANEIRSGGGCEAEIACGGIWDE
jgi:hypothetical protein